MLSKRATGNNGHVQPLELVQYVPDALRSEIHEAFEREGIMNEPAEQRILRALNENHKENRTAIGQLKEDMHNHDKRITLVEDSVKTASNERADTKRLVKGAVIGIAILLAVTGVMGYYGIKGQPASINQEAKQEASDIKELIKEIRQDREERKAEEEAAKAVKRNGKSTRRPLLFLPLFPGAAKLREGEMITTKEFRLPELGQNHIPLGVPER